MSTKKAKFTCTSCVGKTNITEHTVEAVVIFRHGKPITQLTFTCCKCFQKIPVRIPLKSLEVKLDFND